MPKIRSARPASYCSTFIETYYLNDSGNFGRLGTGTAFFYTINNIKHLITNWHVVTGRHPERPEKTLDGYPISPTHYRVHLASKANPIHIIPSEYVSLYEEERPIWIESALGFSNVDIVALPLFADDDDFIISVDEFAPIGNTAFEPGIDVCIIGFPFGQNETNPFPIWKRAMVASEPNYTISGRPFSYIDTPGRAGMSGSPVYFIRSGFSVSSAEASALHSGDHKRAVEALINMDANRVSDRRTVLEFAGVYSGSYGDGSLERLNLGRFWPSFHITQLETHGIRGSNPFFV